MINTLLQCKQNVIFLEARLSSIIVYVSTNNSAINIYSNFINNILLLGQL